MYNYEYIGSGPIRTVNGVLIATTFVRVVVGDRGAYVEFTAEQILPGTLHIPPDQVWRTRGPLAYYEWYETPDGVKVYRQTRRVGYADYIPGRYYMSPVHLKDFIRKEQL